MVVKSKEKKYHLSHLQESCDLLRKYNMKLNLENYTFGVT